MPVLMDHVIEGNLQDGSKIDFAKEKLAVRAFVKGQEVGQANVDSTGHFKVNFTCDEERPTTELRVTPGDTAKGAPIAAATEKLEPIQFSVEKNLATAHKDVQISANALEAARLFSQRYHMSGTVFAQIGGTRILPAAALKMDFYELSTRTFPPPRFPQLRSPFLPPRRPVDVQSHLGTAYTDPDGKYDFKFFWSLILIPWQQPDPQPDILVRISQFEAGAWNEVFCGPVDWDIVPEFERDFLVPGANLQPSSPIPPLKHGIDFAFTSIGAIPVDDNHLKEGYAFTYAHDPLPYLTKRPFGETLRVGGLFAKPVTSYTVEIALTNGNHKEGDGVALAWEEVLDSLYNLKWNDTERIWEYRLLGPDPVTHHFTNIDTALERDWFEHSLKFTFNSARKPDGFYAFRITGYDDSGKPVVGPMELPVLCFDNTPPLAALEVQDAGVCGGVKLDITRNLQLKVTAFDAAGHVLNYGISATRGNNVVPPEPTDKVLTGISPSIVMPTPGCGIDGNDPQSPRFTVHVGDLPAALTECSTVAYNIALSVVGSATNGYSRALGSQCVVKQVNLMISEPQGSL